MSNQKPQLMEQKWLTGNLQQQLRCLLGPPRPSRDPRPPASRQIGGRSASPPVKCASGIARWLEVVYSRGLRSRRRGGARRRGFSHHTGQDGSQKRWLKPRISPWRGSMANRDQGVDATQSEEPAGVLGCTLGKESDPSAVLSSLYQAHQPGWRLTVVEPNRPRVEHLVRSLSRGGQPSSEMLTADSLSTLLFKHGFHGQESKQGRNDRPRPRFAEMRCHQPIGLSGCPSSCPSTTNVRPSGASSRSFSPSRSQTLRLRSSWSRATRPTARGRTWLPSLTIPGHGDLEGRAQRQRACRQSGIEAGHGRRDPLSRC